MQQDSEEDPQNSWSNPLAANRDGGNDGDTIRDGGCDGL